jgi:hypothetical protein
MTKTPHTLTSSYREILIEHLLVGENMRRLWLRVITQFAADHKKPLQWSSATILTGAPRAR